MAVFIFILAALASVASALVVISSRRTVTSLLFLVATFFCLAVIYVTLGAQFIAAMQVIVYAGAIMVLFLFVVMLLDQGAPLTWDKTGTLRRWLGYAAAGGVLLVTLTLLRGSFKAAADLNPEVGTVASVGAALFSRFLLPFEIASVLLLTAIIGVVALVKREPPESPAGKGGAA